MVMVLLASALLHRTDASAATQTVLASVYAKSLTGHRMANGQRYDPRKLIAAHRTLPFGTQIRLTNPKSNKSVVLCVVDRGPYRRFRTLDITPAAADELGFSRRGVHRVMLDVLEAEGCL
jgi:rare lipoprotein A